MADKALAVTCKLSLHASFEGFANVKGSYSKQHSRVKQWQVLKKDSLFFYFTPKYLLSRIRVCIETILFQLTTLWAVNTVL